jgi:hypothetical protein
MSEAEAMGYGFVIDHYEPQKARPDLTHEYNNLMYSCEKCNLYKAARFPTPAQLAAGYRFFRCDEDVYADHFELEGNKLKDKTKIGDYTISCCHLNREALQRLRDIRRRLLDCNEFIQEGLVALRHSRLDQLPPTLRARANTHIVNVAKWAEQTTESIDDVLRSNLRSVLLDEDPQKDEKLAERAAQLRRIALFPDAWHSKPKKPN